jgi:inosine/xanthosine triphosphate pyrophosphatase family protein
VFCLRYRRLSERRCHLLDELSDAARQRRRARVIAVADPAARIAVEGVAEGRILSHHAAAVASADPSSTIRLSGATRDCPPTRKNAVSHRAMALAGAQATNGRR